MVTVKFYTQCHNCKKEVDGNPTPEEGWYNPYHVWQGDGWLQTQLCPDCCPKFSPFMWIRRHPSLRFMNHLYANFFGYFWLPCGVCGRYFGGHEKHGNGIKLSESSSQMTCSNC